MELDPNFLEFIELLDGHEAQFLVVGGYAVALHGRVPVQIGGVGIPFISLEDLRRNKRAAARHQDLADSEALDEA